MLIKCPKCKKMFEDNLSACPFCGFERHIVPLILNEQKQKEEAQKLKEENKKKLQLLIEAEKKNTKKIDDLNKSNIENKEVASKLEEIQKENQKIKIGTSSIPDSLKPKEGVFESVELIGTENLEYSINSGIDVTSLEKQILAAEKLEAEKLEAQKIEEEKLKAEKLKAQKIEEEKLKAEKLKAEILEIKRLEKEKLEAERLEKQRIEAEKLEKLQKKWEEAERKDAEKRQAEKIERDRIEAEKLETQRIENMRLEKEKAEQKKLLAQKLEEKRIEDERLEREKLEKTRLETEKLEAERKEAELLKQQILEAQKREAERIEAERIEAERINAEKLEEEKREAKKLQAERNDAKVIELLSEKKTDEDITSTAETANKKVEFLKNKQVKRLQRTKGEKKPKETKEVPSISWKYISKESITRKKKNKEKSLVFLLILLLFMSSIGTFIYFKPKEASKIYESSLLFISDKVNIISRKISSILHPGKANVSLITVPAGAEVILDGVDTKKKTPVHLVAISEGKHDVAFKLNNYDDFVTDFSVLPNKEAETSFTYKLFKSAGLAKLDINSNPGGAAIFIDDKATGKVTPAIINIKAGEHKIVLKLQKYLDFSITQQIIGDKTFTFSPKLVPIEPKGIARFVSNPIGAEIWLNGKDTGKKTPYNFELTPETYSVVLRKEGYQDWNEENIKITDGFDETFYAYLIKKY